jgi:hypothetical protein
MDNIIFYTYSQAFRWYHNCCLTSLFLRFPDRLFLRIHENLGRDFMVLYHDGLFYYCGDITGLKLCS